MLQTFSDYWPHILVVLSVLFGAPAMIHAAMTKEDVRAAIGWVGVILLSPILGAALYLGFGVNRIYRKTLTLQRAGTLAKKGRHHLASYNVSQGTVHSRFGASLAAMKRLGDTVSRFALTSGNTVAMLASGDEAYAAMLEAIRNARRSILLETYIFDRDGIGLRFAEALTDAVARGVDVHVLIDAVGARYSTPSMVHSLQEAGLSVRVFNGNIAMGLRLPYANLRTHRKILVVDGEVAFTGGLNIRAAFCQEFAAGEAAADTHFRVSGPIVADIFHTAYEDWHFSGGIALDTPAWRIEPPEAKPNAPVLARAVPSGPDKNLEANQRMLIGAISIAKGHIRIMSPYFLPDRELISALATAARRGVRIDIVVPGTNNLKLVDLAMTAQFDQLLKAGCNIWRARGVFNHSKLTSVDGVWSYVGSSNLDPRSLRLNFEIDIEVFGTAFAEEIEARIDSALENADAVEWQALRARPFLRRLTERIVWLGSPYL